MPPPPATAPVSAPSDRHRTAFIVAAIAALIALPVGVSIGMAWVDLPWADKPRAATPKWVALPTVRATTGDGTAVKTRVAVDVVDDATRDAIQRRTQQVVLLLETSVGAHSYAELSGAQGIAGLGADMALSLNRWLEADGIAPVRKVVVQDLLLNSP